MKKKTVTAKIAAGYLMPHPPIIVPEVGKGAEIDASDTIVACNEVGQRIAHIAPETIVFISPHAPLFSNYLFFFDAPKLSGSFARFGVKKPILEVTQEQKLIRNFSRLLEKNEISGGSLLETEKNRYGIADVLDHGVLVPLYFIQKFYTNFTAFVLSPSSFNVEETFKIGQILGKAIMQSGKKTCILASGDMSHKANENSSYGCVPEGALFDNIIAKNIKESTTKEILKIDQTVRVKAAECGYNAIVMLLGAIHNEALNIQDLDSFSSSLLSYEAPFGIGYCVAEFSTHSMPVEIAKKVIHEFVIHGSYPDAENLPLFEHKPAGCFVTLYKNGELRGCIGTIAPSEPGIVLEIQRNAIQACSKDPRFSPVRKEELDSLCITVDILDEPEPIDSKKELDPNLYGVIVSLGYKRGLLLPMIDGVDTVEKQLDIACKKAGIDSNDSFSMQRFKVTRYR